MQLVSEAAALSRELTRAEQDQILAEHGVTVGPDELAIFDGEEFMVIKFLLKPTSMNRQERRAQRAAQRQRRST